MSGAAMQVEDFKQTPPMLLTLSLWTLHSEQPLFIYVDKTFGGHIMKRAENTFSTWNELLFHSEPIFHLDSKGLWKLAQR